LGIHSSFNKSANESEMLDLSLFIFCQHSMQLFFGFIINVSNAHICNAKDVVFNFFGKIES